MLIKNRDFLSKCIFFMTVGFVCLAFASRSSFLYPLNNWDEANSFFSVGKGLFNGKMPYRDIFDNHGMYLYFFYGLCYLISHTSFIGVFMLEIFCGIADLVFAYKIIRIYASDKISLSMSVLTFGGIMSSRSFWFGGSAEELCLPFMMAGLYLFISYFKKQYPDNVMPLRSVFIGGVLAGVIANIKFSGLGFFAAWIILVFVAYLVHGQFLNGIKACLLFFGGMFVAFFPWIIYFGIQGGLYEWYWGYFHVNLSGSGQAGAGVLESIWNMLGIFYRLIWANWMYMLLAILGAVASVLDKKAAWLTRVCVIILFVATFIGIFAGGRDLPHYSLPLSMFAVFGGAFIAHRLDNFVEIDTSGFGLLGLPLFSLMIALMQVATFSVNIPFMAEKRDDFYLYRFRDEVLEMQDSTLLNVGGLDAGLYTLCDIVPDCRWFQTQNLDSDDPSYDLKMEQERYISEGVTDYVLVRDNIPESIDDHYDLIDQEKYTWKNNDQTYYLYKKLR